MITSSLKTATNCLAGALYVLNNCSIHSRYIRRGIGKRQVYQAEQFLLNDNDQVGTLIYLPVRVGTVREFCNGSVKILEGCKRQ